MICRSCGKHVDDDAKFCTECGAGADQFMPDADAPGSDDDIPAIIAEFTGKDSEEKPAAPEEKPAAPEEDKPVIPEPPEIPAPPVIPEPESFKAPEKPDAPQPPVYGQTGTAPHAVNPQPVPPPAPPVADLPEYVGNNPPPQPEPEEEEEPQVKVGAGRLTGAFIISLFAAIFLICLSLAFSVKLGVSGEIIKKRTEALKIGAVLDSEADGDTVSNDIFKSLKFGEITSGAADKYNFREYMAQTNLLPFAAKNAGAYADYLVNGKGTDPSVSVNDITAFFENNDSVAADTFGRALGNTEYSSIRRQLENNNVEESLSIAEWSRKAGFKLGSLSYIFSFITLGIFAALVLVLLIWIAVIVDRRGRYLAGFFGNIFLWSGLIVFLVGAALLGGSAIAHNLTNQLVYYLCASVFMPFSLFAMATGAFEFVVGFILKKVKKAIVRRQRREKYAEKAVEKALAERNL